MKPTVRIVHNLARSGGTIIARCLGCMDGVALLSEIHPEHAYQFNDPTDQARDWYGIRNTRSTEFDEIIVELAYWLGDQGKALVLRSWDFVDFMPSPWNNWRPTLTSTLAARLADSCDLRRAAIVRDAVWTWQSLERFLLPEHRFPRAEFERGYRAFGDMAEAVGSVRYEDFCLAPAPTMARLCGLLDLPLDAGFVDKWRAYRNVTGDVGQFGKETIGNASGVECEEEKR